MGFSGQVKTFDVRGATDVSGQRPSGRAAGRRMSRGSRDIGPMRGGDEYRIIDGADRSASGTPGESGPLSLRRGESNGDALSEFGTNP
jgi:hypothetical protein